ncbi:MAG: type II toxin-antitoxin system RelB/DinJ family antitoxin [Thermoguttaceae bacterium]
MTGAYFMATTNVTVRMDENLKKQFDCVCDEIGLSMGGAITIFAKKVVNEQRIPFELSAPSPNKATIEAMLEAEKLSSDPNAKRYSSFREAFEEAMDE